MRSLAQAALGALASLLLACGGADPNDDPQIAEKLLPASQLAKTCATLGLGEKLGTLHDEKAWVRSFIDERYLWYQDVPRIDPADYGTTLAYFNALKTPAKNSAGEDLDRFHFSYPTSLWDRYSNGSAGDYGIEWGTLRAASPRKLVVMNIAPNSPAQLAGIVRGDKLVSIDGESLDGDRAFNAAIDPDGNAHAFVFERGSTRTTHVLQTATYAVQPVRDVHVIEGTQTGYIYLDSFVQFNIQYDLKKAVEDLQKENITDLVIDLRYNGGGLLFISSQLAYMVAGQSASQGKTFDRLVYSDKRSKENFAYPFLSSLILVNYAADPRNLLPQLNLKHVSMLVDHGTASASEALINGLRGVGVQVDLIGGTTYGKPYGFQEQRNCGRSYFAVEFKGENALGFSDYDAGFAPNCKVPDDPGFPLGDANEPRIAAALYLRTNGVCPVKPSPAIKATAPAQDAVPVLEPRRLRTLALHTPVHP